MARERAKSMDQRPSWALGTAEALGKRRRPPMALLGTGQNASVRTVPRVHPGNVGQYEYRAACLGRLSRV